MGTVLKQVLGIDVAQNELVVTFGRLMDDLAIDLVAHKVFKNTENGSPKPKRAKSELVNYN
jgi:hypothetical protein